MNNVSNLLIRFSLLNLFMINIGGLQEIRRNRNSDVGMGDTETHFGVRGQVLVSFPHHEKIKRY